LVNAGSRHPGGKVLIQPDIVPPFHGDQVAEPLMGHFMREDADDSLMSVYRSGLVVNGQKGLAIGDGRGVFHGAGGKIGKGNEVELLEGIFNVVVPVVELQNILGGEQREGQQLFFLGNGANANGDAVGAAFESLKIADHHSDKVCRHFGRR
jgi:hypothetical protein